ncbi:hypothetical protein Tco_1185854 [Tanacetum coccineum]
MGCENGIIGCRMLLAASLLCAVCEQIPPATVCDREWFWKTSSSCPFPSVSFEHGWFNRLQESQLERLAIRTAFAKDKSSQSGRQHSVVSLSEQLVHLEFQGLLRIPNVPHLKSNHSSVVLNEQQHYLKNHAEFLGRFRRVHCLAMCPLP